MRAEYEDLPAYAVTANQLVAYNTAYWRQQRGLRRSIGNLLAERTGRPWSKATVSAAERSWDGKRVRQFDADELVALCWSLNIPLGGLFLPPTDDGQHTRAVLALDPNGDDLSMQDLLFDVIEGVGDETDGGDIYDQRSRAITDRYMGEGFSDSLDEFIGADRSLRPLTDRATELQTRRDVLRALVEEAEQESARIATLLGEEDEYRQARQRLTEFLASVDESELAAAGVDRNMQGTGVRGVLQAQAHAGRSRPTQEDHRGCE